MEREKITGPMKHSSMIVAVTVALIVYSALNYYCIKRSAQALTGLGVFKTAIICALVFLAIAFPLGRIAELCVKNALTRLVVVAGSLYLAAMFYMALIALLADCVRLADRFFHFFSPPFLVDPYPVLRATWLALAGLLCITIVVGNHLATHPRLRCLDLSVARKTSPLNELTIAVVSDIHFGTVVGEKQMNRIVRLVKQANPDLVLLVGDVFDEDVDDCQRRAIVALLKEIASVPSLGVYAVTGNHDYYSGLAKAVSVLGEGGVAVLQDSAVRINKAFNLVGRKDLTALRIGG
ncbi:MAG: metallophosphoesterase, partial [Chitinivibrionales bacterium]